MSRQQDRPHGTFQLEDVLHALHGLHVMLPTEHGKGMTPQEVEAVYFLMKELLQRLEDVFDLIMHERIGQ